MKASELRIGNFVNQIGFSVQDGYPPNYKKLDQIKEAKQIDFSVYMEPIPLTEEWLIKFGYIKVREYFSINDDWLSVHFENQNYYIYINSDKVILQNVHQLQNLYFALTNEELIIKNK